MVGPFIFFDHFGPAEFRAGNGIDVRPHPHIGLATVTYLFDGEIMHRDSLGTAAAIQPGEVNWMTAGRGIVHSERTAPERRRGGEPLHGLQFWVALPSAARRRSTPSFAHHRRQRLADRRAARASPSRVVAGALLRRALAGRDDLGDDVRRRRRSRPARRCRSTPSTRSARSMSSRARSRSRGDRFAAGRLLVLPPGDRITRDAQRAERASSLLGGAADGWPAPHLVEFRLLAQGAHRAGQGGLEAGRFDIVPGDESGVHPAAG